MGFIDDIIDVFNGIVDAIGDAISDSISGFFGRLFYYVISTLCNILKLVYNFFAVFAGLQKVQYDGKEQYLINVFFGNKSINNVYWGMALIGIVFVFALAIVAVVRKIFDMSGKQQQSLGAIVMSAAKSILTILLLSAVMSAVLNITNLLIDRVAYIFDHADTLNQNKEMVFTDEQFATMARIYNTIGNYSVNDSYNSRYNLNKCYNEIRVDLLSLQEDGVFDFYYDNSAGETWQSMLQRLIKEADPKYEVKVDSYTSVASVILDIMEELKTNADFFPVSSVKRDVVSSSAQVSLDRVVFLMGTLTAAKNSKYNADPSLTDGLRGPFYYGDQNIYSLDHVSGAFQVKIGGISFLLIGLMAWITLKNLTICIFNCIARIFNLMGLYIIAPPLIAVTPLDGGEKFKQWMTAAVVQMFSIFGSIIPMRLVILFIPMVLDQKLVLFPGNTVMNVLAKALLILGSIEASSRFSSMLTGILANTAGHEAVRSGDMSQYAGRAFGRVAGAATSLAGSAVSTAANLTGAVSFGRYLGGQFSKANQYMTQKGGLLIGGVRGAFDLYSSSKKESAEESRQKRQSAVDEAKLQEDEKKYGLGGRTNYGAASNQAPANSGNKELPPNLNKHS